MKPRFLWFVLLVSHLFVPPLLAESTIAERKAAGIISSPEPKYPFEVQIEFNSAGFTTPEAEIREALDSGKPERIKAAYELAAARESGDRERVKAAIDVLAKAIRSGT